MSFSDSQLVPAMAMLPIVHFICTNVDTWCFACKMPKVLCENHYFHKARCGISMRQDVVIFTRQELWVVGFPCDTRLWSLSQTTAIIQFSYVCG